MTLAGNTQLMPRLPDLSQPSLGTRPAQYVDDNVRTWRRIDRVRQLYHAQ